MLFRPRSVLVPVLGLLVLSLAVSACRPKITAPSEPPLAVRLGDEAFRLQDYDAAIDDYQVYIDSVDHGEYTPFVFYQTALSWYRLEKYEICLDVLDDLSRRYPSEHWVQADALRGDANYKLGRRSAALIAWDEGWGAANAKERPEFRRRIVNTLREMDEDELTDARGIVENAEVLALVEHYRAIKARDGEPGPGPSDVEARLATAAPPPVPVEADVASEGGSRSEAQVTKRGAPASADAVADQAGTVAEQADEVATLSDEVDVTGAEVFEAIQDTEDARQQIQEADQATASFAPLTRVEIPEPPFVDRPVPEPKKQLRVGALGEPVAEQSAAVEQPVAVWQPEGAVAEQPVVAAPVAPPAPASITEEPVGVDAPVVPGEPLALESAPAGPGVVNSGAKIACVLPLTGSNRSIGEAMLRGIRLVFGDGHPQLVFRDTGSDTGTARGLVGELGGDADVLLAIAPASGSEAPSLASSAEAAAVPLLLMSSSAVPNSRYVRHVGPAPTSAVFAERYRAKYGSAPDLAAAQAYEAARLAQQALQISPVPRQDVLSRIAASPSAHEGAPLGAADAPVAATDSAS